MRGAYDFETWQWKHPIACSFVWGAKGQRKQAYMEDAAPCTAASAALLTRKALRFMQRLTEAGEVTEWWAHNGGKFDGLFMVQAADELGWRAYADVAGGGRGIRIRLQPPVGKAVLLLDSFAVVSARLEKAANSFELSTRKLFTKKDYETDVRAWDRQRLKLGCLADSHVVLDLLDKVESLVVGWGGQLKVTFSATALSIVRARLAEAGLELPSHKGNQDANDFCRTGYYGGRVEVLHHCPPWKVRILDVNSSYPASMAQQLPWELLGKTNPKLTRQLLDGRNARGVPMEGMVAARVTVPECAFPVLPFRPPRGGMYFPTGQWEGVFSALELRYAMKHGVHVEPFEGVAYTAKTPFRAFIEDVYRLKSTSTGPLREFCKFILNGCYGKFCQKPERESLYIVETEEDADELILNSTPGTVGRLGPAYMEPGDPRNRFLTLSTFRYSRQTHYALASYITSRSRMLLHEGMLQCPGVAYVDADSLHVPMSQLPSNVGAGLGQWKLEKENLLAEYFAPKLYRHTKEDGVQDWKAKGFPLPSKKDGEADAEWRARVHDVFEKIVKGTLVPFERMRLLKSQLRRGGKVDRMEGDSADMRRWHGKSSKRCPLPDGSTRPWTVAELLKEAQHKSLSPLADWAGPDDTDELLSQ